jgi:hypothetical protein
VLRSIIAFLLLFPLCLSAAQVTISGESNLPSVPARLIVLKDYVSNAENVLASVTTDLNGKFKLTADIQGITFAQIALGLERTEIVLKPGATYTVKFVSAGSQQQNSYFEKDPPSMEVLSASDDGLYRQISDINLIYNTFVMQHFDNLYRRKKINLLDSLQSAISSRLPANAGSFVKQYSTLKQATLRVAVKGGKGSEIWLRKLLDDKSFTYNNPEYFNLLTEVYRDYFLNNSYFKINELQQEINTGYSSFMKYLTAFQPLSGNQSLSEVISLINLRDLYYNSAFDQSAILRLLDGFQKQSSFAEHRQIAANLIVALQYLTYGTKAPDFSLGSNSAQKLSLADLSKKHVLMIFADASSPAFQADLVSLKTLYDEFKSDYEFVVIATKESFPEIEKVFRKQSIPWPLLNLADQVLLTESYRISTYPDYIILLKEGKIGMAPAPRPDQYLSYHLTRLRTK